MPNRAQHISIGFTTGCLVSGLCNAAKQYEAIQHDTDREFDLGELAKVTLLGGGAGAAASALPDILEPATSPNHRGFFHSVFMLVVMMTCLFGVFGNRTKLLNCGLIAALFAGYISHLSADGETPMGLPAI